jgi:hypothetical protein
VSSGAKSQKQQHLSNFQSKRNIGIQSLCNFKAFVHEYFLTVGLLMLGCQEALTRDRMNGKQNKTQSITLSCSGFLALFFSVNVQIDLIFPLPHMT